MNNPCEIWARKSILLDTQLSTPYIKDSNKFVAWDDNNTFENTLKTLKNFKSMAPDFFETYDYEWVFNKVNYDFPQEVFLQQFTLDAAIAIWINLPEYLNKRQEFGGLCPRFLLNWDMSESSPRIIPIDPSDLDFRFISVPYSWLEINSICMEALLIEDPIDFSIDDFNFDKGLPRKDLLTPYWDSLIIRGLAGALHCPETLIPEFTQIISDKYKAILFPNKPTKMTSALQLKSLSQRYTIAHEVGHHLEGVFESYNIPNDKELYADQIAIQAISFKDWEKNTNDFLPLISDASFIPLISGIAFYFNLMIITNTNHAINLVLHEKDDQENIELLIVRIHQWYNLAMNPFYESSEGIKKSDYVDTLKKVEKFFEYSMHHAKNYNCYVKNRVEKIYPYAKIVVEELIRKNPDARDPEAVDSTLKRILGNDVVQAANILLKNKS